MHNNIHIYRHLKDIDRSGEKNVNQETKVNAKYNKPVYVYQVVYF